MSANLPRASLRALTLACALATLASGPAFAESDTDWTGFYAGGMVSFTGGEGRDITFPGRPDPFLIGGTNFGAFAGYNQAFGPVIIGIEASYAISNADGSNGRQQTPFEVNADYNALARLGLDAGRLLPWVGMGVHGRSADATHGPMSSETITTEFSGLLYAAGVDFAVSDRTFLRLSYQHVDFGVTQQAFFGGVDIHDFRHDADWVTIGYGFQF